MIFKGVDLLLQFLPTTSKVIDERYERPILGLNCRNQVSEFLFAHFLQFIIIYASPIRIIILLGTDIPLLLFILKPGQHSAITAERFLHTISNKQSLYITFLNILNTNKRFIRRGAESCPEILPHPSRVWEVVFFRVLLSSLLIWKHNFFVRRHIPTRLPIRPFL